MKKTNGITLVALIITVIVMLILVAVTVSVVINSNLIGTAQNAVDATEQAYENEKNLSKITIGGVTYPSLEAYTTGWDEISGVNYPKLADGMVAVYWATDNTGKTVANSGKTAVEIYSMVDENGNPSSTGTANPNFDWNLWFNYVAQTGTTDGTSRWANAITEDGSYWVWIPRFEYKITQTTDTTPSDTNAGTIDVRFISTDIKQGSAGYTTTISSTKTVGGTTVSEEGITISSDGYIIHPAFTSNIDVGGFGKETAGFWVAKYEMGMETSTDGIKWNTEKLSTTEEINDVENGNIATTNAGNSNYVRAVSKPNVSSWRWINIANCYTNSYYYDRTKDSHLMKNSEWGAVAYLAHSQYGRNGNEIYINNSSTFITGNSGGSINATATEDITYAYNTENGILASSTGNINGVYDLSGGAWERVAAFNSSYMGTYFTDSPYLDAKGKHFATTGGNSTKYATKYYNDTEQCYIGQSVGNSYETFEEFEQAGKILSITGDAIKEVHIGSFRNWFYDYSNCLFLNSPFFYRGGRYILGSDAGIFFSHYCNGGADYHNSFRVVCTP